MGKEKVGFDGGAKYVLDMYKFFVWVYVECGMYVCKYV